VVEVASEVEDHTCSKKEVNVFLGEEETSLERTSWLRKSWRWCEGDWDSEGKMGLGSMGDEMLEGDERGGDE